MRFINIPIRLVIGVVSARGEDILTSPGIADLWFTILKEWTRRISISRKAARKEQSFPPPSFVLKVLILLA